MKPIEPAKRNRFGAVYAGPLVLTPGEESPKRSLTPFLRRPHDNPSIANASARRGSLEGPSALREALVTERCYFKLIIYQYIPLYG